MGLKEKSEALVPESVIAVDELDGVKLLVPMGRFTVPWVPTDSTPKSRESGGINPGCVKLSATVCGPAAASSAMVMIALNEPEWAVT